MDPSKNTVNNSELWVSRDLHIGDITNQYSLPFPRSCISLEEFQSRYFEGLFHEDVDVYRELQQNAQGWIHPSSRVQVLLIAGATGIGKTHFLRTLVHANAPLFQQALGLDQSLADANTISAELDERLKGASSTLLLIDKAEEFDPVLLRKLFLFISSRKQVKLVITVKASAEESIRQLIADIPHLLPQAPTIQLPKWSASDLLQLLHLASGKDELRHEGFLVESYNTPRLTIAIASQLEGNSQAELFDLLYAEGAHTWAEIRNILAQEERSFLQDRRFGFKWIKEKDQIVHKIKTTVEDQIVGLVSIQDVPRELRLHIRLIEVNAEDRGSKKRYDHVAGCLIAFTCQLAFHKAMMVLFHCMPRRS